MDEKELYATALQISKTIERGESYATAIEKIYKHLESEREEAMAVHAMINFIFENNQIELVSKDQFSHYFGQNVDTYLCKTRYEDVTIYYSDDMVCPVCEF